MATFRQLQTFITVAECKKMKLAADKLYISQPSVSQTISDLEKEYHTQLFQRTPNELKITDSGKKLLQCAYDISSAHEKLEQSMKHLQETRPLRIGATVTIGNSIISPFLRKLKDAYPDIDIWTEINNTQVIERKLLHNELDIALVEGIINREEIFEKPVIPDSLIMICGNHHTFFDRDNVTINELRNQKFILREEGSGTRRIFEDIMQSHHIPLQVKWECCSTTAILEAVKYNHGISVISKNCLCYEQYHESIHPFSIKNVPMERNFYLCYLKKAVITSQMQDFIRILEKSC